MRRDWIVLRCLVSLFLLASSSAATCASAAVWQDPTSRAESRPVIVIHSLPYRVGDVMTPRSRLGWSIDMQLALGADVVEKFEARHDETMSKSVTVLAMDGRRITRVKVTYVEKSGRRMTGDESSDTKSPLVGRTFSVDITGAHPVVRNEAGEIIADEMRALVLAEEVSSEGALSSREDRLAALLPAGNVAMGQVTIVPANLVQELFAEGTGARVTEASRMTLTVTTQREVGGRRCIVLAVDADVHSISKAGETMTNNLRGELIVDADTGRFAALELEGPVSLRADITGAEARFALTGSGRAKLEKSSDIGSTGRERRSE